MFRERSRIGGEIRLRRPGLKQQPLTCLDYLLLFGVLHTAACRLHRGSAAVALLALTLQYGRLQQTANQWSGPRCEESATEFGDKDMARPYSSRTDIFRLASETGNPPSALRCELLIFEMPGS